MHRSTSTYEPPSLFDGKTFDQVLDGPRLNGQLKRVFDAMKGGGWWTIEELTHQCGGSPQGISARIRDLKKSRWGSHRIQRERVGEPRRGVWRYRLVV